MYIYQLKYIVINSFLLLSSSIMATAQELRQLLKEDAGGRNLYEHLTETLMRIVLEVLIIY